MTASRLVNSGNASAFLLFFLLKLNFECIVFYFYLLFYIIHFQSFCFFFLNFGFLLNAACRKKDKSLFLWISTKLNFRLGGSKMKDLSFPL